MSSSFSLCFVRFSLISFGLRVVDRAGARALE
jgi:hypothetical protein